MCFLISVILTVWLPPLTGYSNR